MSEMTMSVLKRDRGMRSVSADELAQWLTNGPPPMILDVRDARAFRNGHLPMAENTPVSNAAALVSRIPDDGLVVLICDDGLLSREVARLLDFCGFRQVASLDGGLRHWSTRGYRVVA